MGIHHVADALTGLAVLPDEEVTLVLLVHDGDGVFHPDSLPVSGRYDGYGGIVPTYGQASVVLAAARAGVADWDALAGPAHRSGARPRPAAVMGSASWERLRGAGDHGRDRDVERVSAALRDVAGMIEAERVSNADVTMLGAGWAYPAADGTTVRLPPLAGALAEHDAGRVVSPGLADWLRERLGGEWPRPVLEGLHDLVRLRDGLAALGRTLSPSRGMAQEDNASAVVSASLATILGAAGDRGTVSPSVAEAARALAGAVERTLTRRG